VGGSETAGDRYARQRRARNSAVLVRGGIGSGRIDGGVCEGSDGEDGGRWRAHVAARWSVACVALQREEGIDWASGGGRRVL
jgi:hypothetical protein